MRTAIHVLAAVGAVTVVMAAMLGCTQEPKQVGSPVEFEITLPPEVTGGKEDVVIQCRGRVVRTDEPNASAGSGENRGVACVIDSYEFVRNS
jgi:hypothetical protein